MMIEVGDTIIFTRNPGSPLPPDAVRHIGKSAKVISKDDDGIVFRIEFCDGSRINAFRKEVQEKVI